MIKGFIETSFVDWPGRSCAVIFTGGCNLCCPFCHNYPLVLDPESLPSIGTEEIITRISAVKKWLGGVCVTGGEPTLHHSLPDLLARLRACGLSIKLDTNGTRPRALAGIIEQGLVDMIDMDVKAPLDDHKYRLAAGTGVDLDLIRESIELIKDSGLDYRFRITVTPRLHQPGDIIAWKNDLPAGATLKLQNFRPGQTLDPDFADSEVFSDEEFAAMEELIYQAG